MCACSARTAKLRTMGTSASGRSMCTACPQPSTTISSLPEVMSVLLPGWAGKCAEPAISVLSLLLLRKVPTLWVPLCISLTVAAAILAARATNLASSCPAMNWTGTCRLGRRSHRGSASPGEPSLRTAARPSAVAASPRLAARSENLHSHLV